MSWRRLAVLVRRLPADSATAHAISPAWSTTDQLLAGVLHSVAMGNWQRGGGKGPRPKPVEMPGAQSSDRSIGTESLTPEELAARFAEFVDHGRDHGSEVVR